MDVDFWQKKQAELEAERQTWPLVNCPKCGKEYHGNPRWNRPCPEVCPDCAGKFIRCEKCKRWYPGDGQRNVLYVCKHCEHSLRALKFVDRIPSLYSRTDPKRLPCPAAFHAMIRHPAINGGEDVESTHGFYCFGDTGTGKTRTAYLACHHYLRVGWMESARLVRGSEFAKDVPRLVFGKPGEIDEYIEELASVDVLAIDEVDKFKLSERVEAEFFDLLERRLESHNLTILISNIPADQFAARFSEQYRDAVKRRIFELFTPIRFKATKRKA